jgi:citrate/tricarballylate utilization protein
MCPVFSTLTNYRQPALAEFDYLANLCHNCGACFDVCQYAEPHPFQLNVPVVLAEQRLQSYEAFAWPLVFAKGLRMQPKVVVLALLGILSVLLLGLGLALGSAGLWSNYSAQGSFYAVMPHQVMALLGGATFGFAMLSLGVSCYRFARHLGLDAAALSSWQVWRSALSAAVTLRYLGDSQGCQTLSQSQSPKRRGWHHVMAGGFVLCFASTCVATLYHYGFGLVAPYAWLSLPVLLGGLGGLGLVVGPLFLVRLKLVSHKQDYSTLARSKPVPSTEDPTPEQLNISFLLLLAWVSGTGLALLALRDHASMPVVLAVHLGAVFSLFLLMPYSKFVHAPYRLLALLKHAASQS